MFEKKIMIDDWVDELPLEMHLIVFQRALNRLCIEYTLRPEGGISVHDEIDEGDEALNEAMSEEYKRAYGHEILGILLEEGEIEVSGVAPDGEIEYAAVSDS